VQRVSVVQLLCVGKQSGLSICPYKKLLTYLPRKMEQTECSETSAYKIRTPGNYPEENIKQEVSALRNYVRTCLFYMNFDHHNNKIVFEQVDKYSLS
jgi:hypothetical protein